MNSLGSTLKEARLNKKFTLEEISQKTKISTSILTAIEEDDTASLPPRPFLKGFVRTYAQFLGLNPHLLLSKLSQPSEETKTVSSKTPQTWKNTHSLMKTSSLKNKLLMSGSLLVLFVVILKMQSLVNEYKPESPASKNLVLLEKENEKKSVTKTGILPKPQSEETPVKAKELLKKEKSLTSKKEPLVKEQTLVSKKTSNPLPLSKKKASSSLPLGNKKASNSLPLANKKALLNTESSVANTKNASLLETLKGLSSLSQNRRLSSTAPKSNHKPSGKIQSVFVQALDSITISATLNGTEKHNLSLSGGDWHLFKGEKVQLIIDSPKNAKLFYNGVIYKTSKKNGVATFLWPKQ